MDATDSFVYLNGRILPRSQATLDIEDRGVMFGDGVYEVVHFYRGRPFALQPHLERLRRSLRGIELAPPPDVERLGDISAQLVERNRRPDAGVYWQITRGPAPRAHAFPPQPRPTVLVMTHPVRPLQPQSPPAVIRTITAPDARWDFPCYKTLMLLPNVLAKERAHRAGADEAILHRGGRVTEGSSTNVFIVSAGAIRTHPADQHILGGITREVVLDLARRGGVPVVEQAPTLEELLAADEVFITGSTTEIAAVARVDDRAIGPAATPPPGPITRRLYAAFLERVLRECGGD